MIGDSGLHFDSVHMSRRIGALLLVACLVACRPALYPPLLGVPVGSCDTASTNVGPAPGPIVPLRPSSPSLGAIAGTVADHQTGAALVNAVIRLKGDASYASMSDSAGRFGIPDVTPGSYAIVVTRIGYDAAADSIQVAAGRVDTLHISVHSRSCP